MFIIDDLYPNGLSTSSLVLLVQSLSKFFSRSFRSSQVLLVYLNHCTRRMSFKRMTLSNQITI